MDEIPLVGGNVNTCVVRVGDTVRRTAARPAVHRFLRHLEQQGFAAPRFLGHDDKGREVLSFLPGTTDYPPDIWTDERAMIAAAKMLRDLHDASAGCDMSGPWALAVADEERVICHNDFAPYNMVFNDGVPTGIFDFDLCGPGPRLRDLAYLAYWMVPLSFAGPDMTTHSECDAANNHRRLRLICKTYGTQDFTGLLTMVSNVLHHMSDPVICAEMVGDEAAQRLANGGNFAHWLEQATAFDARKPEILACLS